MTKYRERAAAFNTNFAPGKLLRFISNLREGHMPSEKLTRILKAKSPFSAVEIEAMSEADGWDWVYGHAKPRKEKLTQVCFTGFSSTEKAELAAAAAEARLEVVASVTKNLAFLCAGENAGPTKLDKAREQGVHVLTRVQFIHLLETGEVQV